MMSYIGYTYDLLTTESNIKIVSTLPLSLLCTFFSFSLPATVDSSLLHSIETIIIDWSHQIRDILSKDSAQPLLDGLNPLPRVEFDFWYSRQVNLQCINEQVGRRASFRFARTSACDTEDRHVF